LPEKKKEPVNQIVKKIFYIFPLILLCTSCNGRKTARDYARVKNIDFGMAVSVGDLSQKENCRIIRENSTIIVAENCMKWANLRPNKTFWNWSDVDNLVSFAEKNHITVKWHTLFWHNQNPGFLSSIKTKKEAESVMDTHIKTIMERYKGRIRDYDVVNEMFNEDGSLRDTIWLQTMGPAYIEYALCKAHEIDPDAQLYLNEYNNEAAGCPKADAMYMLVKDFVLRGIPITGVGMQMHLDASLPFNEDAVLKNIRRYAALGIKVSFSEVDVRIPASKVEVFTDVQKDIYCRLLKMALDEPNVTSFIMWGFTDKASWIPSVFPGYGYALPYDRTLKPKPVYKAMLKILRQK
jgi:endo-1,4-beta-xylanase